MMILGPESKVTVVFLGPRSEMPESFGFDIGEHAIPVGQSNLFKFLQEVAGNAHALEILSREYKKLR